MPAAVVDLGCRRYSPHLRYNCAMATRFRSLQRDDARFLLARLKEVERLLIALDSQRDELGNPVLLDSAAAEMVSRARQIADEVDTTPIPAFLEVSAVSIGDAAVTLQRAIESGEVVAVSDDDPLVRAVTAHQLQFASDRATPVFSRVTLAQLDYHHAVNYYVRAAELLRQPASSTGLDISTLDVPGGVPL